MPHGLTRRVVVAVLPLAALFVVLLALAGDSSSRPTTPPDPTAAAIATNVATFTGSLDQVGADAALSAAVPLQDRTQVTQDLQQAQAFADEAAGRMTTLAGTAGLTLTSLDQQLDDLDGNGDSSSDSSIPGLGVDINGTVNPKTTGAAQYVVTLQWTVHMSVAGPVSFLANGITVTGQPMTGDLTLTGQASFRYTPAAATPRTFLVTGVTAPLEQAHLTVGADFGNTDPQHGGDTPPLAVTVGILGTTATGTADADATVAVKLRDANGDGVVDTGELASPATLFNPSCGSGRVHVGLQVTSDVAGLSGTTGAITLADGNVCDGLLLPTVALGNLADFQSVTEADVVNGLAQLTTALQALQVGSDLDLPFVKQNLSSVVQFNARLVKFFVDNGFTDPNSPMANISADAAHLAPVATLQTLMPKLATALGLPSADALGLAYADHAVGFTIDVSVDPGPLANAADLDFGDQLAPVGLTGLKGTAKATIDPAYHLHLGLGIDLRPGLALTDRFYFSTGPDPEITADAAVSADVSLTGSVALIPVTVTDANTGGAVPLLQRATSTVPMLSVNLDGRGDNRLTLTEIATAASATQLPYVATTHATVPSTPLTVAGAVAGTAIPAGTVTLAWPDISAPASLAVTADTTFQRTVLPFDYDQANPVGVISQVMKATRDAVVQLRGEVAGSTATTADLPLVGRSASDFDPILSKLQDSLDDIVDGTSSQNLSDAQGELAHAVAKGLGLPASAEAGLVRFEYQPATSNARAALVAHLRVGVCTTDRTRTGCTANVAPSTYPLGLQLGTTRDALGLAGLANGGTVNAGYDALLSLDVGVELPTVVPGGAGGHPTVPGSGLDLFVLDGSTFDLGVGVSGSGTLQATLGPAMVQLRTATLALAARFHLAAPSPTGARLQLSSPAFASWLSSLPPSTVHDTITPSGCAGGADACASLPVFLNNTATSTITFSAPDLLNPAGWSFSGVDAAVSTVQAAPIAFGVIKDGLATLVQHLAAALQTVPTGTTIPLLGDNLTAGVDVVTPITNGLVSQADSLASSLNSAVTAADARSAVRSFFVTNLGPSAPNALLEDANHDGRVDGNDVTVLLTCTPTGGGTPVTCADSDSVSRLASLEVHAPLGTSLSGGTPAFDIGFPGFRLESKGHLTGHAGFTYNLAFGVDTERGFYIPTAGALPELQVTAGAGLPNVTGPADDLTGDIAFLPISGEDQHAGDDVQVSAGVDITGGDSDGHLGLQELGTVTPTPTISVCANTSLQIATALDSLTGGGMPKLSGTLNIRGGYSCDGSLGAPTGSGFAMSIDDVSVDVGSFVNQFIRPIVDSIHKVTGPLEPVVDAITAPVPGVEQAAKLAGLTPPRWYDLFKLFAAGDSDLSMIDHLITLVNVVKQLDANSTGSGSISIGSFDLNAQAAATPLPTQSLGQLVQSTDLSDPRSVLDRLGDSGVNVPALGAIEEAQSGAGFSFPVWDNPASLFGMLIGQDVTLVHYDPGVLSASASFEADFNVGPLILSIGGGASISGHFQVGYDTAGFRYAYKLLTDDDPTNNGVFDLGAGLIQGFYVDDLDASGKDVPEITFSAYLSVGAGVGIPGFNVQIEGGVKGELDFDLNDPDGDGKVHFGEFVDELKINPNPLCLFIASARISAFIQIDFTALFISWTIPIADVTLYEQPDVLSFCAHPDPGLATKYGDGTLALATTDQPDDFLVDVTGPGAVTVSAKGTSQQFTGVTKIFADGGQGADDIAVISHTTARIPAVLCGGLGDDHLSTLAGPGQLYGDDGPGVTVSGGRKLACSSAGAGGNDVLTAGADDASNPDDDSIDAQVLDGGPGSDTLVAGAGNDTLTGDAGNDSLRGGYGTDSIDGGDGDDTSDYADHTGGVAAGVGTPGAAGTGGQVGTSEHDTAPNVEDIVGSPYDDQLTGPATGGCHIEGLGGNDTITGGGASEIIVGGDGNDVIKPGGGTNFVYGNNGDDTFVNGVGGTDVFQGGAGFDTADYSAATTPVNILVDGVANDGPTGEAPDNVVDAEHLIGGAANDTISGAATDDVIEGNGGNDNLIGGGGNDTLIGGAGNDRLEGDDGADDLHGGVGYDTADYGNRTDALTISEDDVTGDGAAADGAGDNVHTDIEHLIGGSNADLLRGRVNLPDLIEAGPGNDTVLGNGGNDHLDGGTGDDDLVGGSGTDLLTGDDGTDQLVGSAGNDTLDGGTGDDALSGGAGADTLTGDAGRDVLRGGPDADTVHGGDDDDVVFGDNAAARADDGNDTLTGDAGNDRVYGGGGNDTIDGGTGNDTVTGEGGDDALVEGGPGNDTVSGGTGNDTVDGGDDNDTVNGNAGNDIVLGGNGNDQLLGGAGNDTLTGGAGDDKLSGDDGDDVLDGGTNADQLLGGNGNDTVTYASRTESLDLSVDGYADDGSALDVPVAGGSDPADSISSDVESVVGGSGDDTLSVAIDATHSLDGGPGDDTLTVAPFVVHPQTLHGSAGNDTLTGGGGADVLDGGAGNDVENGGSGDDRFAEGTVANGADTFSGGAGFDIVDYSARSGPITVTFDNKANDGATGEKDNARNDVERAFTP